MNNVSDRSRIAHLMKIGIAADHDEKGKGDVNHAV